MSKTTYSIPNITTTLTGGTTYPYSNTITAPVPQSWVSSGTYTIQDTTPKITIRGDKPIIELEDGEEIDLRELVEMMKILREMLMIVVPDRQKMEKYAALKNAYEYYKTIEATIGEEEDTNK